jgi:hypothetical protein
VRREDDVVETQQREVGRRGLGPEDVEGGAVPSSLGSQRHCGRAASHLRSATNPACSKW